MGKHAIKHCNITLDGNLVSDVTEYAEDVMSGTVPRISRGDYPAAMAYDRDGRLVADSTRHIARIDYEAFGAALPRFIDMGTNSIMLRYRPDGTLAQRRHTRRYTELFTDRKGVTRERVRTDETRHTFAGSFESVSGRGWIYHFDGGYVMMTDGEAHYFARDYQGSTRAVYTAASRQIAPLAASADGAAASNGFGDETVTPQPQYTLEQVTDYYPTGLPVDITAEMTDASAASAATDRLHIGNRWINHAGLGYYDNTARYFDALTVRFTAADRLEWKYYSLSPWAHCAGNPVNLIDPSGMKLVAKFGDNVYDCISTEDGFALNNHDYDNRDQNSLHWALRVLGSTKAGALMLTDLINSEKTITIVKAEIKEVGAYNSIDFHYDKSSRTVYWSEPDYKTRPTIVQFSSSSEIKLGVPEGAPTLGHELYHAESHLIGTNNSSQTTCINVIDEEIRAVTVENFIRSELGLPIRAGYTIAVDKQNNIIGPEQDGIIFKSGELFKNNSVFDIIDTLFKPDFWKTFLP